MKFIKDNLTKRANKKQAKRKANRRRIDKAVVETLETRQLMSSSALIDGTLTLSGDANQNNHMSVHLMEDGQTVQVKTGRKTRTFELADVEAIKIVGGRKSEVIDVDPRLTMPLDIRTFDGNDVVMTGGPADRVAHNGDVQYDEEQGKNIVVNATAGPRIASFTLINADTDEVIAEFENLGDGMTVNLATLPTKNLNIRANVADGRGSVFFEFSGGTHLENVCHYTLAGNNGDDFHAWTPSTGEFKLSATPYSHDNRWGVEGVTKTITLNFTDSTGSVQHDEPAPQPEPAPEPQPEPQPAPNPAPDDTGEVGAPVPVITTISKTVQAGHSIHVNALATNFKSGDAISAKYEWNFGDEEGKWNTLAGWNAAHVYDRPGTYTITLRVTNAAGKVATTTTNVTIAESTRRVIYVSNDGSDSSSGTSPKAAVKSFAKAMSMATSNTEILFNRGDRWNLDYGAKLTGRNIVIGSYGTGSRPVLKYTGDAGYKKIIALSSTSQDVTIRGLAFDMRFTDLEKKERPDAIGAQGTNITIRDNEFINIGYAVNAAGSPRGLMVVDNVAPRDEAIRSYFVWASGSDFSIVGNTIANSTREHNIRVVGVDRILIAHNDLTNTHNKVSGDDTLKGTLTIHKGSYVYVSRNKLNDGTLAIGPLGDNDGLKSIGDRWNWAVVEDNEINTRLHIDHGASHVMVRNNVFSDVDRSPIDVEGWNATYRRGVSDVRIENNLALATDEDFVTMSEGDVDGLKQSNNRFVSSVSDKTLWADADESSPTQWQALSTIYGKAA